jgi:WD40 repeat protein
MRAAGRVGERAAALCVVLVVVLVASVPTACGSSAGSGPGEGDGAADGSGATAEGATAEGASDAAADGGADATKGNPDGSDRADAPDAVGDSMGGGASDHTIGDGSGTAGDAMSDGASAGDAGSTDGAADASGTDSGGSSSLFSPCAALGIAQVRGLAYLPDGSAVAAALGGAVVKLIAPSDSHEVGSLLGHSGAVNAVVVSTDGSTIASASDDRSVRLWRASDGTPLGTLDGPSSGLKTLAISPDGTRIAASAADGEVFLWNRASMSLAGTATILAGDAGTGPIDGGPKKVAVSGVGFAAAGTLVLTTAADGSLRAWSSADLSPASVLRASGTSLAALAVSPDGEHAATGDGNGGLTFWHVRDGKVEGQAMASSFAFSQLAYAPDGTRVYSVSGGSDVYEFPVDGSTPTLLTSPIGTPAVIAPSPDSKTLFVASAWALYSVDNTGHHLAPDVQQGPFPQSVAFWPDGGSLLVGGDFGVVVRSLPGGAIAHAPAWSQSAGRVNAVAVSPAGTLFATGDNSGVAQLWSATTWMPLEQLGTTSIHVDSVGFSPDGKFVAATGSAGPNEVYSVPDGGVVDFLGSSDEVEAVAFSPDGSLIAYGTQPGNLGILRTSDWSNVASVMNVHVPVADLAFSPDGRFLVTTGDARVSLWPVGPSPTRQDVLDEPGFIGNSVAVSPDGALLAAGGSDGTLRFWSMPAASALAGLPGHGSAVVKARFSHDGRQLAVAYTDETVWLWCRP